MYKDESISHQQTENHSHTNPESDYQLRLIGSQFTYFKEEIVIDFEPVKAIDPYANPPSLSTFSIIPVFNNDCKYYTAAFLNPFDYEPNQEGNGLKEYRAMLKEYSRQIPQKSIQIAKPRNSSFCCVCRTRFEDYLTHLEEPKHNKLIKKAKYSNLIEELREMLLKRKGRTESSTGK